MKIIRKHCSDHYWHRNHLIKANRVTKMNFAKYFPINTTKIAMMRVLFENLQKNCYNQIKTIDFPGSMRYCDNMEYTIHNFFYFLPDGILYVQLYIYIDMDTYLLKRDFYVLFSVRTAIKILNITIND